MGTELGKELSEFELIEKQKTKKVKKEAVVDKKETKKKKTK